MSAVSLAAQAETALQQNDTNQALELLTKAIAEAPTSPTFYLKRSKVYQKLSQYDKALADTEQGLANAINRQRREDIGEAQHRRGVALFFLERYGDARQCFEWAKKGGVKGNVLGTWAIRIDNKLKALPPDTPTLQVSVVEKPSVSSSSQPTSRQPGSSDDATQPKPASAAKAAASVGSSTPAKSIRHEWYQSHDSVFLSLFAKNIPQDKAVVDIQPRSVSISFPLDSGADFDFSIDPFFAQIKSGDASHKILPSKLELTLPKEIPGMKWAKLEGEQDLSGPTSNIAIRPAPAAATTAPSAAVPSPYASKGGPKNWDKIADSFQKPVDDKKDTESAAQSKSGPAKQSDQLYLEEEDEYEGDPANHFFKKLYAGASDEQKRAMMKSFQESGGTSLSTNWDEVSKKTVVPAPPEGMEAKKW